MNEKWDDAAPTSQTPRAPPRLRCPPVNEAVRASARTAPGSIELEDRGEVRAFAGVGARSARTLETLLPSLPMATPDRRVQFTALQPGSIRPDLPSPGPGPALVALVVHFFRRRGAVVRVRLRGRLSW